VFKVHIWGPSTLCDLRATSLSRRPYYSIIVHYNLTRLSKVFRAYTTMTILSCL